MTHVFISYKHEDTERVLPLIRVLEAQKFTVWWDDKISPGKTIPAVIREALDEVSCVVVVWSKLSVKSNWVLDEAGYGRDRNILVSVAIDDCERPLGFQQLSVQSLAGWNGSPRDRRIRKVVAAVGALLSRPRSEPAHTVLRDHRREAAILQYHATRNKRVFLIAGSFNEEWQISLNVQIMHSVQQADLTCAVMVPSEDHSVDQQRVLLRSILNSGDDYLGGFVVCSGWPDHLLAELLKLAEQLSMPVVLIDRNPPIRASRPPPMLGYVSVNDEDGGRLAAEAVVQLAKRRPVKRILVIAGYAKRSRFKSFQKKIKASKALSACEVTVTEDGRFDRWVAENVTYNFLNESIEEARPFDVIFCVADSMTVGCLDAIARFAGKTATPMPKVIGYDGTSTTRTLVENRRSPLARIVVQDSREIARAAVAKLLELSQEENKPAKSGKNARKTGGHARKTEKHNVVWVEPYLFPRVERSG